MCSHFSAISSAPAISRTFSLFFPNWNHVPTTNFPLSSPWQPPFYFLSLNLTTQNTLYKWSYAIFVFLWLASQSIMSSRFIHVIICVRISFLKLNNILLYMMYRKMCKIHHILFILLNVMDTLVVSTSWPLWQSFLTILLIVLWGLLYRASLTRLRTHFVLLVGRVWVYLLTWDWTLIDLLEKGR